MSEDFHDENNAKLKDFINAPEYLDDINTTDEESDEETKNANDHLYASFNENSEVSSSDATCQTTESEVKSLKEWLLLHNDLIQQQNDDIIDKERQIFILQKENEMLKERLKCLEKGIPYQTDKVFNHIVNEHVPEDTVLEDMTQHSGPSEEDCKENIELVDLEHCDDAVTCSLEVLNHQAEHNVSDVESQIDTTIDEDILTVDDTELKSEDYIINSLSDSFKTESDVAECNNSLSEYNFTVNNFSELDPMKNIRMSIKRKRVCSNSSALSSNEPALTEEKKSFRRFKKKRRCIAKVSQFLTSTEPYVIQASEVHLGGITHNEPETPDVSTNITLEVPRWRVKHYASCYTMEGTENLDDEVYNKRHIRLEIDERRRKRWDVQRIREQKVIEKLKQRQERVGSGLRTEEQQESLKSLWPKMEDIKYLEVSEELPVSAFGHPIPKIPPSNFNLPWLNNPTVIAKKPNSKRPTVRRKNSRSRR